MCGWVGWWVCGWVFGAVGGVGFDLLNLNQLSLLVSFLTCLECLPRASGLLMGDIPSISFLTCLLYPMTADFRASCIQDSGKPPLLRSQTYDSIMDSSR